ncbi:MAG: glycosyltransferase [bacterium]|nr:glycosyltransferase [bacterium]
MIKISVIVPVYNVEKYLPNCLQSLVNQNYNDYEIIIINDGSTDNSEKIIKDYKTKYPKLIKYYKKDNGGLSSARNLGIVKSIGEYLLFVDSDDSLEINALNTLANHINKKKLDIIVFNLYSIKDNIKEEIQTFNTNINDKIKKYIIGNPSACNKLIKKDLFIKNNLKFKEGIYYEDLMLMPILIKYTNKIDFINKNLYNYYIRSDSITNKINYNKKMNSIFIIVEELYKELNDNYKEEIEFLYIEHLLRNASLRYIDYKKYDKINNIINLMKDKYKFWYKNIYFKKYYNIKQKIMCYLIYNKKFKIIKIIRKR